MTKDVIKNTAGKYASRVIGMAIGFFTTPYLLAKLGPETLGLQVIAFQILQYSSIVNGSFSVGYFRFATVYHARGQYDKMNNIVSQGLFLTMLSCIITISTVAVLLPLSGSLFGTSPKLMSTAYIVIGVTTIGFIFGLLLEVWSTPLHITQRMYAVNLGEAGGRLLSTIIAVVVFMFIKPTIEFWSICSVVVTILIQLALVLPFAKRSVPEFHIKPKRPDAEGFKSLMGFSVFTLIGSLGYLLYFSTDSIIISKMLGQESVYLYNLGQRWDTQIRAFVIAFISGLTPEFTRLFSQGKTKEIKDTFLQSIRFTYLIALLPTVFLFVYGDPFLRLWVGEQYVASSGGVLKLVMAGLAVTIGGSVSWEALVAVNKVKTASLLTLAFGVVNIALAVLFVRLGMGIFGVGLASVIALALKDLICLPFIASRSLGVGFLEYLLQSYTRPLLTGAIVVLAAYLSRFLIRPLAWPTFIASFALFCVMGGAALFGFGLHNAERWTVLARIGIKRKNG